MTNDLHHRLLIPDTNLAAINGDRGIERHVLRLERRHAHTTRARAPPVSCQGPRAGLATEAAMAGHSHRIAARAPPCASIAAHVVVGCRAGAYMRRLPYIR